jgi:hypothetical protein
MGNITFHPRNISWSYLNRGNVQRTQIKTQQKKSILIAKVANDNTGPGSATKGTPQPPKYSVTTSAEAVIM